MPDSYINPPDCRNEVLDEVGSAEILGAHQEGQIAQGAQSIASVEIA